MEWDEFQRHSQRRQLVKVVGHLLDSRRALSLAVAPIKNIGSANEKATDIEQNIDVLCQGINDTLALAGQLADEFKREMTEPNANPPPITASCYKFKLTPMQRALQREGKLDSIENLARPKPTKTELRLPKILDFDLTRPKRRNRNRNKTEPPL